MPQEETQTFRQFCENELSKTQFNTLYQLPNVTKYSITNALKRPQKMSFDLLLIIAKELEMSPLFLAQAYECSLDKMTARQYLYLQTIN
ncbi:MULTISPECIES: hypothetical protein [unclassified Aureispira]|uniref:hypothetical protein n=1 Tax=unclassified Aureispira TaxID=2649989 RepID=UPI0006962057|nr:MULTISPECIES: hypothetical protein [unclassified Aureispira]WMX15301.1 hypothetical protein QP953_02810 [Aureispira sp. CCB-E]